MADPKQFQWRGEAHEEMAMASLRGLFAGDLCPLVGYLRSEYPIDPVVRVNLADVIEGIDGLPYGLGSTLDKRAAQRLKTALLDVAITRHILEYERRHGPVRESAIHDAMDEFKLKERRVRRALERAPKGNMPAEL